MSGFAPGWAPASGWGWARPNVSPPVAGRGVAPGGVSCVWRGPDGVVYFLAGPPQLLHITSHPQHHLHPAQPPLYPAHHTQRPTPYILHPAHSPPPTPFSRPPPFTPSARAAARVSPSVGSVRLNDTKFTLIEDALAKVFDRFDMIELQRANSTCRFWRQLIDHNEDLRPKLPAHVVMSRNFIGLYKIEQVRRPAHGKDAVLVGSNMKTDKVQSPASSHR